MSVFGGGLVEVWGVSMEQKKNNCRDCGKVLPRAPIKISL